MEIKIMNGVSGN